MNVYQILAQEIFNSNKKAQKQIISRATEQMTKGYATEARRMQAALLSKGK